MSIEDKNFLRAAGIFLMTIFTFLFAIIYIWENAPVGVIRATHSPEPISNTYVGKARQGDFINKPKCIGGATNGWPRIKVTLPDEVKKKLQINGFFYAADNGETWTVTLTDSKGSQILKASEFEFDIVAGCEYSNFTTFPSLRAGV
jgi:hypothetical protein